MTTLPLSLTCERSVKILPADQTQVTTLPLSLTCELSVTILPVDQTQVTTLPLSLTCDWSVTILPADQTQVTTLPLSPTCDWSVAVPPVASLLAGTGGAWGTARSWDSSWAGCCARPCSPRWARHPAPAPGWRELPPWLRDQSVPWPCGKQLSIAVQRNYHLQHSNIYLCSQSAPWPCGKQFSIAVQRNYH